MIKFDYETAWKEVKAFEDQGLPKSALNLVDEIYKHAKSENIPAQFVKAIIHQLKFIDTKEEDAFVKNLNRVRAEALSAEFPVKPLLHSMLAEMYWSYYTQNRYRFYDRTDTPDIENDDIATWSLQRIVAETHRHYLLSLKDEVKSKGISIDIYVDVLYEGDKTGRAYRPTLYDFLAHRALNFFSGEEPGLTKPAEVFLINDEKFFQEVSQFVTLATSSPDSLSMKLQAVKLFQSLLRFHQTDADPASLITLELQRLGFIHSHYTKTNKNELYIKALTALYNRFISSPHSTLITHQIASLYVASARLYNPLQSDDHKWDLKKAHDLCTEAIKKFPDSNGSELCKNLQLSIETKSLESEIESVNVPRENFRSLIRYKNFTTLHYRILKVTREEVQRERRKHRNTHYQDGEEKFLQYFLKKKITVSGRYTLPDDHDFQQHSTEIKLDPLPEGTYMIVYSNRADFKTQDNGLAYSFSTISNIAYIHRTLKGGNSECYVLHRQTGEPMTNVKADVYTSNYNYKRQENEVVKLGTYTSDSNGFFKIPYANSNKNRSFSINFSLKNDSISTESIDSRYGYREGAIYQYQQPKPEENLRTHFFLDRAIYRPGQIIYFKGIVVITDEKTSSIKANYKTKVGLFDVNGEIKAELEFTTNEYGTFSGTFNAPATGLTGEMAIRNLDNSGTTIFSVEEYKRPKFEVQFEPVKGSFRLHDVVKTKGKAAAYSGAAIDGASVQYRVVRNANFPFWWWSKRGYFPESPEMEIISGVTQTDDKGYFTVDFSAIPDELVDPSSDPVFNYTIYADVTDINGETHSTTTTVPVAYKALKVNVDIPNINKANPIDTSKEIQITTQNLSGSFEPAKGLIQIYVLKSPTKAFRPRLWAQPDRQLYSATEYYKLFPHDLHGDEMNKFKWAREKEVFSFSFDTGQKQTFQLPNVQSWQEGEYIVVITSKDKDGKPVQEINYFTLFNSVAKQIPIPQVNYFQGLKLSGEPGEHASFVTGTAAGKIKVLYEIEQDGLIVSKEFLSLNNEQKLHKVALTEKHRGNIGVHYTFVRNNRLYHNDFTVVVPYTNKQLDISFETFRNKLQPGEQEEWKIKIKGKDTDKVAAEMVASLYDESLDEFRLHNWSAGFFNSYYAALNWQSVNGFQVNHLNNFSPTWNADPIKDIATIKFDSFNWFGYNFYYGQMYKRGINVAGGVFGLSKAESNYELAESVIADSAAPAAPSPQELSSNDPLKPAANTKQKLSDIKVRTNLNETAFFFPHLQTNAEGEIIIKFTIPEALTRWKMLGFAHTKDLQSAITTNSLVTQKELMIVPNQPRFFREQDKMSFSIKITSLADKALAGEARLEFFDAFTMKPIDVVMNNKNNVKYFSVDAKKSTPIEWTIEIPEGLQALTYRVVAKAENFSDGEEMTLPVVTNRMLVTETLALPIRGNQTKAFKFEKLLNNKSTTLRHQQLTVEFTSNPVWLAVQALPYLMEYPYDCVEQTFSRYYANSIASYIANSNPKIKEVFDTWRNIQPDALLSNLEKNQELKTALLEETPWVLQGKNETQRKQMIGVLFDLNRMAEEKDRALAKIINAQTVNGGFAWFPGLPEDRYITQHIIAGFGHLKVMGVHSDENEQLKQLIIQAVAFLDNQINIDYNRLKEAAKRKEIKLDEKQIDYIHFHYLYVRSYFKDLPIQNENKEAFDYFMNQAKKYWVQNNLYTEGMACLALHRYGETSITAAMIKSFNERALNSEERGMYWKTTSGYYWYQAPIETQALMIEVYDEVARDQKSVEDLKVWLLKQKQTQDWKTTKATVEACYALLRRGTDLLSETKPIKIKVGNETIDLAEQDAKQPEAGTGYFKRSWASHQITSAQGNIQVSKSDDGVAWGAAYWQYFEQLDKITPAETPLKIKKELFLQKQSPTGPILTPLASQPLHVGDLIKVRMELRVDRNMEYVHLKDMRASALEPITTLSTHRYQDGLHYYESPRDMAMHFFIGYLPKGTYVFEYSLRVSQKGDFSNGITTIQCMYAPEFTSHSQGVRIKVE